MQTADTHNGWRKWTEHPPCIPWAPVRVALCAGDIEFTVMPAVLRNSIWAQDAVWCGTGIYRQEFYDITGRWE